MNTVPGISSHHGIYPTSPEAMERGKETEIGEEPMEMECMAWGRSVLPAAEEGSALSIMSARHDASMAGIVEAVGRISLCQGIVQKATSGTASATLISRDSSGRIQLPRGLETIVRSRILATISQAEQNATGEQLAALTLIKSACNLVFINKLADAYELCEIIFQYLQSHPEDWFVNYTFIQYGVHHWYATDDIDSAIYYFCLCETRAKTIHFMDRFFIMHLMLGMSVDGERRNNAFRPKDFCNEMQKCLGANDAENEAIKQSLETEFGQNAPQVKIFCAGIEAIFKGEDADLKESEARFEQSVNELTECEKDGTLPEILACSVPMLKFAKGLKLIEQKHLVNLMEDVGKGQYTGCNCLDQYLACEIARTQGYVNEAIEMCQEGLKAGYPFSDYLKALKNTQESG